MVYYTGSLAYQRLLLYKPDDLEFDQLHEFVPYEVVGKPWCRAFVQVDPSKSKMYTFGQQEHQYMPMEAGRTILSTPWFSQSGVESWNGLDQLHSAVAYQLAGNRWRVPPSVPRSRKRTKAGRCTSDITYEELTKHFHLPTDKACKKLGVGLTILKRLCRRFGLARWPYKRPRKSDKNKSVAISSDRDDEIKESAPTDTASEEQEKHIKSDGSPRVDRCEVVENANTSMYQAKYVSQVHGVHNMLADIRGTQRTYNDINMYRNEALRAPGYVGVPRGIHGMEQQERWLSVLQKLGVLPIACQGDMPPARVEHQIGSERSAFTRLNGSQINQKPETAGHARNGHQMQVHLGNRPVAQVETPPASAPTRNLSGYFRTNSVTEDLDNVQGEWNSQQGNPAPQDEAMRHVSSAANTSTRDMKLLLKALLILEQQEAQP